ncbi:MAG: VIT1/CCC1 transporter family protein [Nitrospirota bacterium]|nr:VIT1/CCC1 transporter family protein [Nitrospirota bacterium]MDE3226641.1 VIT1/CCC1 transporter family protein [Nitrospirota bacterium]
MAHAHDQRLARTLILDELFDLSLYQALRGVTKPDTQQVLDELIVVEAGHLAFWQQFFDSQLATLDAGRRLKLQLIILACRLFGDTGVHLALEAIEVYGVRKYLSLWRSYKGQPLGKALEGILQDELQHEDQLVTQLTERKINPERIRNIFLGLNDGLVEILGAVSGFFGAFGNPVLVLMAASTTAVAGSLSMAAGAYAAISSEREVQATEEAKKEFLGEQDGNKDVPDRPLGSALVVGASYFAGAMIPVLPVLFGAANALVSALAAGTTIILVSLILAFLSGMDITRRILTNLVIITLAVSITYLIGVAAKQLWGISV